MGTNRIDGHELAGRSRVASLIGTTARSSADEALVVADEPNGVAVLLLAGSSGRVEVGRARLLSRLGATVLVLRWFGGVGQSPGTYGVPLETSTTALDRLARCGDRLVVVGTSFGAEAALLTAVHDPVMRGGTPEADRELGDLVWPCLVRMLSA